MAALAAAAAAAAAAAPATSAQQSAATWLEVKAAAFAAALASAFTPTPAAPAPAPVFEARDLTAETDEAALAAALAAEAKAEAKAARKRAQTASRAMQIGANERRIRGLWHDIAQATARGYEDEVRALEIEMTSLIDRNVFLAEANARRR